MKKKTGVGDGPTPCCVIIESHRLVAWWGHGGDYDVGVQFIYYHQSASHTPVGE